MSLSDPALDNIIVSDTIDIEPPPPPEDPFYIQPWFLAAASAAAVLVIGTIWMRRREIGFS